MERAVGQVPKNDGGVEGAFRMLDKWHEGETYSELSTFFLEMHSNSGESVKLLTVH